jgi:hypothetical protein
MSGKSVASTGGSASPSRVSLRTAAATPTSAPPLFFGCASGLSPPPPREGVPGVRS